MDEADFDEVRSARSGEYLAVYDIRKNWSLGDAKAPPVHGLQPLERLGKTTRATADAETKLPRHVPKKQAEIARDLEHVSSRIHTHVES